MFAEVLVKKVGAVFSALALKSREPREISEQPKICAWTMFLRRSHLRQIFLYFQANKLIFPFLVSRILDSPQQKRSQCFPEALWSFRKCQWISGFISSVVRWWCCNAAFLSHQSVCSPLLTLPIGNGQIEELCRSLSTTYRQGQPLAACSAFRDLGYHVFFCGGHSVRGECLSVVLLLSGFTGGRNSLSL